MNTESAEAAISPRQLSKLKWHCRRGLLENDLLLERFFQRAGDAITLSQAEGLEALMALADNDLLDLLLCRAEPSAELDCAPVHEVLQLLRPSNTFLAPTTSQRNPHDHAI